MRTRSATTTTALTLALGLALAASGCATEDPLANPTPPSTATGEPTASPEPSEPAASPSAETPTPESPSGSPAPSDEPTTPADAPAFVDPGTVLEQAPGGDWMLTVTNVRVAANDGFDRVVFDLEGEGTPGWRIEYVDEALDDGSGHPVEVDGGAVLSVRVAGVGMPFETGVEEFSGSPVTLDGTAVQEVVYRFVFEGYSTAFVGVDEQRPFRVFTLENPLRLVVDVQH